MADNLRINGKVYLSGDEKQLVKDCSEDELRELKAAGALSGMLPKRKQKPPPQVADTQPPEMGLEAPTV